MTSPVLKELGGGLDAPEQLPVVSWPQNQFPNWFWSGLEWAAPCRAPLGQGPCALRVTAGPGASTAPQGDKGAGHGYWKPAGVGKVTMG